MENETLKWHQKPMSVILLLIFFFPLGLYFMWKNKMWNSKTRWIVTSIILILVIAGANNDKSSSSNSNSNNNKELSPSEMKLKCLRMFNKPDMSAFEFAQAECMLYNKQSACDCMQVLSN